VYPPATVYFDASALIGLKRELATADVAELIRICDESGTVLAVPRVAAEEWVFIHQRRAVKHYRTAVLNARSVAEYLDRDQLSIERLEESAIERGVRETLLNRLSARTIEIVETPALELSDLLGRAVHRQAPFQESDKGFRDTVIVETVAWHADQFKDRLAILIANDKVFHSTDVSKLLRRGGVSAYVEDDVTAANVRLSQLLTQPIRDRLAHEKQVIQEFLDSESSRIFDFVAQAPIDPMDLWGFVTGSYVDIVGVRPYRIKNGWPGGPPPSLHSLYDGSRRFPIVFEVEAEIDVIVDKSGPTEFRRDPLYVPPPAELLEQQTPVLTFVVWATADGSPSHSLSDLQLVKAAPTTSADADVRLMNYG
jgi:PIN domain